MDSVRTDYSTDKFNNSDVAMLAGKTFNSILQQIENSKLNFQLQLSPFSAWISLKKSFIKDKEGVSIIPSSVPELYNSREVDGLKQKNQALETSLLSFQNAYHTVLQEHTKAVEVIESLKTQVLVKKEEEKDELQIRCKMLENLLIERDQTIINLTAAEATAQKVAIKLNKEVVNNRLQFKHEKSMLVRNHRSELKTFKKKLGQANSWSS